MEVSPRQISSLIASKVYGTQHEYEPLQPGHRLQQRVERHGQVAWQRLPPKWVSNIAIGLDMEC
jgi:hypothetical protein